MQSQENKVISLPRPSTRARPERICPRCTERTDKVTCPNDGFSTVRCGVVALDEHETRIGDVICGRFRLEEAIGRGGFGAIFRATQLGIERDVAIKLLHPDFAARLRDIARFQREARAIGMLDHPNIVHLYDFGEMDDGHFYIAMQYLNGQSLKQLLDGEAPLDPGRVRNLMLQVLRALEAAHNKGVIHRDLAPKNVIVTRDAGGHELVKLIDFGIARVFGDSSGSLSLTDSGQIVGSPQYMAPERWTNQPVTGRTDIYSVGCLIIEALTGRPVIERADIEGYLAATLFDEIEPPMIDGDAVAGPLVELARQCLQKEPDDRPASAAEALERLEAMDPGRLVSYRELDVDTTWAQSPPVIVGHADTSETTRRDIPDADEPTSAESADGWTALSPADEAKPDAQAARSWSEASQPELTAVFDRATQGFIERIRGLSWATAAVSAVSMLAFLVSPLGPMGRGALASDSTYESLSAAQAACENGDATACRTAGKMLIDGAERAAAPEEARALYAKACRSGDAEGCTRLGYMKQKGTGGPTRRKEAHRHYETACSRGHGLGCSLLATIHDESGGAADKSVARDYYRRACKLGDPFGCYRLGRFYEAGTGGSARPARAQKLYGEACSAGLDIACRQRVVDKAGR